MSGLQSSFEDLLSQVASIPVGPSNQVLDSVLDQVTSIQRFEEIAAASVPVPPGFSALASSSFCESAKKRTLDSCDEQTYQHSNATENAMKKRSVMDEHPNRILSGSSSSTGSFSSTVDGNASDALKADRAIPSSREKKTATLFLPGLMGRATDQNNSSKLYESPSERVLNKIQLLFNNITHQNVAKISSDLMTLLEPKYFGWLGQYLVVMRISTQPNYHPTFLTLLDRLGDYGKGLMEHIMDNVYSNVGKLLLSEDITTSTKNRSLLKNLGSWLGQSTLARNISIPPSILDCEELLYQGYETGTLVAIVPFVAKILEGATNSVFRPPNPWLMGLLGIFRAIHEVEDLQLKIKCEIEILCKNLIVKLEDTPNRTYELSKRIVPNKIGNLDFNIKSRDSTELLPIVAGDFETMHLSSDQSLVYDGAFQTSTRSLSTSRIGIESLSVFAHKLELAVTAFLTTTGTRDLEKITLNCIPADHEIKQILSAAKESWISLSISGPLTLYENIRALTFGQTVFKKLYELSLSETLRLEAFVELLSALSKFCPNLREELGVWSAFAPSDTVPQRQLHNTVLLLLLRCELIQTHIIDTYFCDQLTSEHSSSLKHELCEYSVAFIRTALQEKVISQNELPKTMNYLSIVGKSSELNRYVEELKLEDDIMENKDPIAGGSTAGAIEMSVSPVFDQVPSTQIGTILSVPQTPPSSSKKYSCTNLRATNTTAVHDTSSTVGKSNLTDISSDTISLFGSCWYVDEMGRNRRSSKRR